MAEVFLVCEGPGNGLDARILDGIVAQKLGVAVQIVPAGGDSSLNSVRVYLEERSRRPRGDGTLRRAKDKALAIEDRNYRPIDDAERGWNDPTSRKLVWRRHEIESYLLEPSVVRSAFGHLRRTVSKPWIRSLPEEEERVSELLARLARSRLAHHAGHALVQELLAATGAAGSTRFRTPPGSTTRGVAWQRAEWLAALHEEAKRVAMDCHAVAQLAPLDPAIIDARYDEILREVQRPEFIAGKEYLLHMGGHELLDALVRELHTNGAAGLSTETLEDELVSALLREYQPGTLFQPDEFLLLRDRLVALGAAGAGALAR